jgi:hypothetical protein
MKMIIQHEFIKNKKPEIFLIEKDAKLDVLDFNLV